MAWTRIYTPTTEGRTQHSLWLDESAVESVQVALDWTEYVQDGSPTPEPYGALRREMLPGGTLTIRFADAGGTRWMTDEQAAEANRA